MKVLMVDDCPLTLATMEGLLSGCGIDVVYSHSIDVALDLCPDLIILDLYMPDKSGIDLCSQLKSCPYTSDIPVVILSSSYDRVDKENCFGVGAIDYLEKPIGREGLINAINTYGSIGVMVNTSKRIHRGSGNDTKEEGNSRDTISNNR